MTGRRVPPIQMVDLPDGPRRKLLAAVVGYYRLAGCPTLRRLDEWIRAHPDLPATPSKETVRRLLAGISVPLRWESVETVFLALCARAGCDPDEPAGGGSGPTRRAAFARLWQEAVVAPPPLVPNPHSRRRQVTSSGTNQASAPAATAATANPAMVERSQNR